MGLLKQKILTVGLMGITLVGCSSESLEFAGTYTMDGSTIHINKDGKITVAENVTLVSSLVREFQIIPDKDSDFIYKMDPDADYIWTYTINKSDPNYDELMDELVYYVEYHGFTTKDSGDSVIVSGTFNEDYFGEFGISYDDPVITDSDEGLYLYSTKISE